MDNKLAIFDIDNTIIDDINSMYEIWGMICERLQKDFLSKEEFTRLRKKYNNDWQKYKYELWFSDSDEAEMIHIFRENLWVIYNENVLYDSMWEVIAKVAHKWYNVAFATNNYQKVVWNILTREGLDDYAIKTAEDYKGRVKPDPAMLLDLMEKFGTSSKNTIFIWDSDIDYVAAQKAKIDFIFAKYGALMSDQLFTDFENNPAIKKINTPKELLDIL